MSTPYFIIISGEFDSFGYERVRVFLKGAAAGRALYELETEFSDLGREVSSLLDSLLRKHAFLLRTFSEQTPVGSHFHWTWEGEGDGEDFLETLLQFFDALGLQGLQGEAQGDEDTYRCWVTDEGIECKYIDY